MRNDSINMTFAEMARRKSQMERKKERDKRVAQIWFIIRAIFCVPCIVFVFANVSVFVNNPIIILKVLGVLACLLVIVTTWEDAKKGFDND